jgi:hypothetical protein
MVDNVNPTTQFHPYQPQTDTPASERVSSGVLGDMLRKVGLDRSKLSNMDVRGQLGKARSMARDNGGRVLGGLAALAIGAGLMRRRSMMSR